MKVTNPGLPKISLYLMNIKGFHVLEHFLLRFGTKNLEAVISAKDPTVTDDHFARMRALCKRHKVAFFNRKQKFQLKGEYALVIGWKWMLHDSNQKLIIIHDALLPRYRGFAPLISCLIQQEKTIGATALFAGDQYDNGPIILQRSVEISYPIKIKEAIEKLVPLYNGLVEELTTQIIAGESIVGRPQNESRASYSIWRDEEDYQIDWNQDAVRIRRLIDALGQPYGGASSLIDGRKIRIYDGEPVKDVKVENRSPGKIIFIDQDCPVVICGKGLLRLTHVVDDQTRKNLLPFKKFKLRFK